MTTNTSDTTAHTPSFQAAFIFALAIAVVNGLARFSYALLLPIMRQDLAWDYTLSGWLNNANSIGYGAGAIAGLLLLARFRAATLFIAGLLIATFTLLACGFTRELGWLMLWRFLAGIGSAWVFACGGSLVASHYSATPHRSAAAIAIFYAGGGLGIALSGLLLRPVLEMLWSWPQGWITLGIASLLLALWPIKISLSMRALTNGQTSSIATENLPWKNYYPIMLAYFLFGIGYIVYLTFVIAWMREMQLSAAQSIATWLLLGLAAMGSGYLWRGTMARWWPAHTFSAACLCTGVGTALPLLGIWFGQSMGLLLVSAALVGGSFFMVPGAMMALARSTLPQIHWAKMMNLFTFVFAIGQAIGPVAAGIMADRAGMNVAMLLGAAVLILSAAIACLQKAFKFN